MPRSGLTLLARRLSACAQVTDVVVVEPGPSASGAPSPAVIATVDVQGNVNQRVISPEDVDNVRALCMRCITHLMSSLML